MFQLVLENLLLRSAFLSKLFLLEQKEGRPISDGFVTLNISPLSTLKREQASLSWNEISTFDAII